MSQIVKFTIGTGLYGSVRVCKQTGLRMCGVPDQFNCKFLLVVFSGKQLNLGISRGVCYELAVHSRYCSGIKKDCTILIGCRLVLCAWRRGLVLHFRNTPQMRKGTIGH